jgi:hypothetical protein
LSWRVHLAGRNPARAALLILVVLLVAAWAALLFRGVLMPLAAAALLLGAVSEFLFPVTFRLTSEWAEARGPLYWRRIAWKEVKRIYVGNGEIKLSPLIHAGPREAMRGVLLRCDGNQPAVLAAVRGFHEAALAGEQPAALEYPSPPTRP